jgi:hypothetical protein
MKQLQAPALIAGLERKARKRKADRERIAGKRAQAPSTGTPLKRKGPPPRLPSPERKSWTPADQAAWLERLCIWMTTGGSLTSFTRTFRQGPALQTWLQWQAEDATIADAIARAREHCADTLADECVTISDSVKDATQFDSARVNAARLAVDARKWVASKLKPKTYADRIETVTSGALTVTHTISDDDRARALATLLTRSAIQSAVSLPDAQRLIEATARDVTPKPRQ